MRKKKTKPHWIEDSIEVISTGGLLPGQDRFFVRQMKRPARIGFLLFEDLKQKKLIIHTLNNETIEYESVRDVECAGWVVD